MALPVAGVITTDMIMSELRTANPGRQFPMALDDPDVMALAGRTAPPVTMPDDFYGKSISTLLSATAVGGYGNADSTLSAGIVSASASVSATGGSGEKSYAWTVVSRVNSPSTTGMNTRTPTVSKNFVRNSNGTAIARLRCTVSDAAGNSVNSNEVDVTLDWQGNQ